MRVKSQEMLFEINDRSVRALTGRRVVEVPFERDAQGRTDPREAARVAEELRRRLGTRGRFASKAVCAIPARGISVRRTRLPQGAPGELDGMVSLWLENEVPFVFNDLEWTYEAPDLTGGSAATNGNRGARVTALVLRAAVLEDYRRLFERVRSRPSFVPRVLLAAGVAGPEQPRGAWMYLDEHAADFALFDDGGLASIRTLSLDAREIALAIADGRRGEAPSHGNDGDRDREPFPVVLAGSAALVERIASELSGLLSGIRIERRGKDVGSGASGASGSTPALEELERAATARRSLPFRFAPKRAQKDGVDANPRTSTSRRGLVRWAVIAVLLAAGWLACRYLPPVFEASAHRDRLRELGAAGVGVPAVDAELAFLDELQKAQLPYLDALRALSEACPQGVLFDNVSMDRSRRVSVQGSFANPQQASELREKLGRATILTEIVLEDLSPLQGTDRWQFRLQARLSDGGAPAAQGPPAAVPADAAGVARPTPQAASASAGADPSSSGGDA